jgi:hypothetical protein
MFTADYHMDAELYMEAAREAWSEEVGTWFAGPVPEYEELEEKFYEREFPLLQVAEYEVEARFDDLAYGTPVLPDDEQSMTWGDWNDFECTAKQVFTHNVTWQRWYYSCIVEMSPAMLLPR